MEKQRFPETVSSAVKMNGMDVSLEQFAEKLVVHPTYKLPAATIALSAGTKVECGRDLTSSHKFMVTFTKNDSSGFVKPFTVTHDGVTKSSTDSGLSVPGQDLQMMNGFVKVVPEGQLTFSASIPYGAAVMKTNNIGLEDATGKFPAGSLSASCTIIGMRKIFSIVSNDTTNTSSPTSHIIRTSWVNATPWSDVNSVSVAYSAGAKVIGIAVPQGRKVSAVSQVTAVGTDPSWLSNFVKTTGVLVEGAAGYTAKSYDLYIYTHPTSFGGQGTFNFTIANA